MGIQYHFGCLRTTMQYFFLLLLSCSAAIARDGRYAFASIPIGESVAATLSEGTTTCGGIVTASPPTPPAATTACTVTGSVTFRQNFFTGANADYEVWLTGSGIQPATQYMVGFSTDCSLAATTAGSVAEQMLWQQLNNAVLSPFVMINGFFIKGTSGVFNVNGASGRFPLRGSNTFFVVARTDGTVIGCSVAAVA